MRRRTWDLPIRITLTCGCTVKTRLGPLNARATYGCNTGLGHGYRLAWTS